jgi:hypothetical protein
VTTTPRRALRFAASVCLALGALTALAATPAGAANPVGYTILQGEGQCGLATVDLVTGALQEIGNETSGKCVFDLAFSPDGTRLFGTHIVSGDPDTAQLVEFDLTTGAATALSQLGDFPVSGPGSAQGDLTFDTSGNLFTYLVPFPPDAMGTAVDPACDGSAFCLFQVDQTDPTNLTYVNHVPEPFSVYYGLATSCAGATTSAWLPFDGGGSASGTPWSAATPAAPGDQTLTSVNLTATGPATTDIGPISGASIASLDYDTAGTLFAVGYPTDSSAPSLFTIDPATGTPSLIAGLTIDDRPSGFGAGALAIPHPCAPTPPPPAPPTPSPAVVVTPRFTG